MKINASLVFAVLRLRTLHFAHKLINFTFQACNISVKNTKDIHEPIDNLIEGGTFPVADMKGLEFLLSEQ